MTTMTRSSTLSLRRPAAAALTTSRPTRSVTTAPAAQHDSKSGTTGDGSGNQASPAAETTDRVLRSDALLQGRSHVNIVHNGETYQLRATRLGKLILTK